MAEYERPLLPRRSILNTEDYSPFDLLEDLPMAGESGGYPQDPQGSAFGDYIAAQHPVLSLLIRTAREGEEAVQRNAYEQGYQQGDVPGEIVRPPNNLAKLGRAFGLEPIPHELSEGEQRYAQAGAAKKQGELQRATLGAMREQRLQDSERAQQRATALDDIRQERSEFGDDAARKLTDYYRGMGVDIPGTESSSDSEGTVSRSQLRGERRDQGRAREERARRTEGRNLDAAGRAEEAADRQREQDERQRQKDFNTESRLKDKDVRAKETREEAKKKKALTDRLGATDKHLTEMIKVYQKKYGPSAEGVANKYQEPGSPVAGPNIAAIHDRRGKGKPGEKDDEVMRDFRTLRALLHGREERRRGILQKEFGKDDGYGSQDTDVILDSIFPGGSTVDQPKERGMGEPQGSSSMLPFFE